MRSQVAAFVAGVIFAIGLALGGMLDTSKVLGFLDVGGAWDPRLMLVMGGAIAVFLPAYRIATRGQVDPLGLDALPLRDPRLVLGAVLFGVGWGLVGYCPGPALVSFGAALTGVGTLSASVFLGAMLAGMALHRAFAARAPR